MVPSIHCALCGRSGLVITMVVSLLFILLLRFTAGVLLWLIIFGVITAVGYGEYAVLQLCVCMRSNMIFFSGLRPEKIEKNCYMGWPGHLLLL